jgi:hypothetical protein
LVLKALLRQAITIGSLEEFQQQIPQWTSADQKEQGVWSSKMGRFQILQQVAFTPPQPSP